MIFEYKKKLNFKLYDLYSNNHFSPLVGRVIYALIVTTRKIVQNGKCFSNSIRAKKN